MDSSNFKLIWAADAGVIAAIVVGDTIQLTLGIEEVLTEIVAAGQFQIYIGDGDGFIHSVTVAGSPVRYTVQNDYVQFPTLRQDAVVEVRRRPSVVFSVLNGVLPPGLSLASDGTLSGTLAHTVDISLQRYDFTVRAVIGTTVRDRAYAVMTSGVDAPTSFDVSDLPAPVIDSLSGLFYRPIGTFSRANHLTFSLAIEDEDLIRSQIELVPVSNLPAVDGLYGGLPLGLSIVGSQISGIIRSDAPSGLYLFLVRIVADTVQEQTFGLSVADTMSNIVDIVPKIAWATNAGSIGTLSVGEPCYLSISATPVYSPAIVFSLPPDSDPLPPGLTLDPVSGDITGIPSYILATAIYSFTVRATSGSLVDERAFSITISQPFKDPGPRQVVMPLPAVHASLLLAGDSSLIDADDVFRPSNPQFGIRARPSLFVIGSLASTPDITTLLNDDANAIGAGNYHKAKHMLLGSIGTSVARGVDGAIVYEVVYRNLIDIEAGAGGFSVDDSTPTVDPVQYFQNGKADRVVYPNSVVNSRLDLATRVGFDTQPISYVLGPAGPELMPLWMRSQQVLGDATTVPGFLPVLVIGYVKPGTGARTVARIKASNSYVAVGTEIVFPKYQVTDNSSAVEIGLPDIDRW